MNARAGSTDEVPRAHLNRQLFSNHFLENRLRREPLWAEASEEASRVRAELRTLLSRERAALDGANEAQTEERWIKPVLQSLGWGFEVQPRSSRHGTVRFPDYALFGSEAEARAAAAGNHRRVLKRALGVLEAKRWRRDLDGRGGEGDDDRQRIPSIQIINYLYRAEQPWGVLTNGTEWRLYFRDADFADTAYFAVDLLSLLDDEPLAVGESSERISSEEAFRYFYLFFRPGAFAPRPGPEGGRWLDLARQSSARYARAVEEALKPRAYRAVTALCRGFVAGDGDAPDALAADPQRRREVLDGSLTLLFRLLFLLYAESRDLLPVRTNAAYRSKSLLQLRERAKRVRDGEQEAFPRGRDFWSDLGDLFAIVNGEPQWRGVGIPVYNGGLFDPAKHAWLADHYVADPELAEALDLLSRVEDPETGRLHYVDYGPLDVRHLGSIYEGLLEHALRVADEDLPAVREDGRTVRDAVPAGELYLATEKGERKTTGSYYTPDYVVQYIVRRTLEPLVQDRTPEEILGLRVLDPAMGSGHFLVAATSFLARAAVDAAEKGDQAVLGEFARLNPEHLRRLVVERCICGVDRNPRAVELSKLSLWLATVQRGKPLNFLDHHLKCGDSLLGARLRDVGTLVAGRGKDHALEAGGQLNPFDQAYRERLVRTLGYLHQIEGLPSDRVEDVEHKAELHRRSEATLDRFRETADVWASALLGNDVSADDYARLLLSLRDDPERWKEWRARPWFARAEALRREHRFFHWDIEFGEVFFDDDGSEREKPGFDAVIGNPPYVRMEEFKEIKPFLRHAYEAHATRSDLYVYFVERSLDLLREGGEYGVIVSNKFLRANYGKKLRALIGREAAVREIVDFGGLPVFPEATVRAAILLLRKGEIDEPPTFTAVDALDFGDKVEVKVLERGFELDPEELRNENWLLVSRKVGALLRRLESCGVPLGSVVDGEIAYGIKTGRNAAFFIDDETRERLIQEDPRSNEVIKPLVVGNEVRRYHLERRGEWLLYLQHGIDISRYPAVEAYLEAYRATLEKRATAQAWYELQQPQPGYREFYDAEKILYPVISREARFAFDSEGLYPNDKCYLIPGPRLFLLAVLNSRTSFFHLRQVVARLEGKSLEDPYLELRTQYMERLPVPKIPETDREHSRREVGRWWRSLYFRGLRLAGVEPEVPEDIRSLGPRIGELEGIRSVVLIGSWARGHAAEHSDVDLLIVQSADGSSVERKRSVYRHLREYPRGLDLHVYSPEELARRREEPASFLSHVLHEGIVLYDG